MKGLYTTFHLCREHYACDRGYKTLAESLGGVKKYGKNTPIPLLHILDSNGVGDCLWALRAVPPEQKKLRDRFARLIACDLAASVLHIYERENPTDRRPRDAILTAERYANGEATEMERDAARDAARAAAWSAVGDAAWAAAWAAAWGASWAASWGASWAASWGVAEDAARDAHKELIRARLMEAEDFA